MRGIGEIRNEKKRSFNASLSEEAIASYEKIGNFLGISRSEVMEQSVRGEINLLEILKLVNLNLEESEGSSAELDNSCA